MNLFSLFIALIVMFSTGDAWADDESYVLGAGDSLSIQVFEEAELSGNFTVGEDGVIDYPLVGRVSVSGHTAKGLDEVLTSTLAARYLKDPQVQVEVTEYRSHPVQVLGAVKTPGLVHLSGRSTVLDVIAKAGGVTAGGVAEVRIKFAEETTPDVSVSLEQLMGDSSQNIQLSAGDVVHISEGMVVYVSGEVNKPGAVAFTKGLTVTQALSKSGGMKKTARTRDAYILRADQRISVNLKRVLKGKAADIALEPDDQIVLQESVF